MSREGSSSTTIFSQYIEDGCINHDEEFTQNDFGGGATRIYKKAVGVYRSVPEISAYYMSIIGRNSANNECWKYEEYDPVTSYYREGIGGYNSNTYGNSFGVDKPLTFGNVIPFFNNNEDASLWSRGLPCNESNWIGGLPITPPHNWVSVPSVSGKNGILSFATLANTTDGNPVTNATESAFLSLTEKAKLSYLYPNKVYGVDQVVGYSGENELYIKWTDSTHFRASFMIYHSGSSYVSYEYTLAHANDEVWVMILMDVLPDGVTHVMRPSFIIKDSSTGLYSYNTETVTDVQIETLYDWLVWNYNGNSVFGEANEEAGGDGSIVLEDEGITAGTLFTQGGLYFTSLYWVDKENIGDFIAWLQDDDVQLVNKWFNGDPMQGLIGLALSPIDFDKNDYGLTSTLKIFGIDTEVTARRMSSQFVELDCGEFKIPFQMGGTYLDYSPYTSIKVWCPYVGMIELNTDDVMNRWIKLTYTFDLLYGTCIAHIKVLNDKGVYSIHYERTGQFLFNLPFTRGDYTEMSNTMKQSIQTSMVAVGSMAGGGLEGGLLQNQGGGVAGSALAQGFNVITSHPHVVYNGGSPSGLVGFMGVEKPYILFELPVLARPERDEEFCGMPSYIMDYVSNFSDFTVFKSIHLTNIPCTEKEQAQIESILRSGVIIKSGSETPSDTPQTAGNTLIVFLKNISENNVLGKTFASNQSGTIKTVLEGNLVYNQSIENPRFLIKGNVIGYNYAYIPMFNRFYYISDIVCRENDLQEISFNVDVLQSFKTEIKNCEGIASLSTDRTNYFINDGSITAQQNKRIITQYFKNTGVNFSFNRQTESGFLITVANFK